MKAPLLQPDHVDILLAVVGGLIVLIVLMAGIIGYFLKNAYDKNTIAVEDLTTAIQDFSEELITVREHNTAQFDLISSNHARHESHIKRLFETCDNHGTRLGILEHEHEKNHAG